MGDVVGDSEVRGPEEGRLGPRELKAEGGKELLSAGESDGDLVRRTSNGDVIDDSGKSDPREPLNHVLEDGLQGEREEQGAKRTALTSSASGGDDLKARGR